MKTSLIGKFATLLLEKRVRNLLNQCQFNVNEYRNRFYKESARLIKLPKNVRIIEHVLYETPTITLEPKIDKNLNENKAPLPEILFFHGGGFVLPTQKGHLEFCADIVNRLKVRIHIPDYRLAPEHAFPSAFEDCFSFYKKALEDKNGPGQFAVMGDSAGGGLAMAVTRMAIERSMQIPKALVLLSPVTGYLLMTENSLAALPKDKMFNQETFNFFMEKYIGEFQDKTDFRLSPISKGFKNFPPLFFTTSQTEALYLDSKKAYDLALAESVEAEIFTVPELFHVFPLMSHLPESQEARKRIVSFLKNKI